MAFRIVVTDYSGLISALRVRAEQLKTTHSALDEVSGLCDGYFSKLTSKKPMRRLGVKSLKLVLDALGLQLVIVENPETAKKFVSRLTPRRENLVRHRPSAAA